MVRYIRWTKSFCAGVIGPSLFRPMSLREQVKLTQSSRDGGVDAIAFDPDPVRGGKIAIQAKRYTNVVGVSAARDLFGTVMNEGAMKGYSGHNVVLRVRCL